MPKSAFVILAAMVLVACHGTLETSDDSNDSGIPDATTDARHPSGPPDVHYATGPSCRTTRPPGASIDWLDSGIPFDASPILDDGGFLEICDPTEPDCCASDAECAAGKNGRCVFGRAGYGTCSYDDCFSDSDCSAGMACVCDDDAGDTLYNANICVPSNCRVDSDCSVPGYCSPAFNVNFCNDYDVYTGVYCHTPDDECNSNADCGNAAHPLKPYCVFNPEVDKWTCVFNHCAG